MVFPLIGAVLGAFQAAAPIVAGVQTASNLLGSIGGGSNSAPANAPAENRSVNGTKAGFMGLQVPDIKVDPNAMSSALNNPDKLHALKKKFANLPGPAGGIARAILKELQNGSSTMEAINKLINRTGPFSTFDKNDIAQFSKTFLA
jgi:hypothetical protein